MVAMGGQRADKTAHVGFNQPLDSSQYPLDSRYPGSTDGALGLGSTRYQDCLIHV